MSQSNYEDKGFFRRQFPRRAFVRLVGVLSAGQYGLYKSGEIGEGGMSLTGGEALPEKGQVVVSFQIPSGEFVSLRAVVRSCRKGKDGLTHGLSFEKVHFSHKRQIRSFVSARSDREDVIF